MPESDKNDDNCYTLSNGECIGEDCMHDEIEDVVEPLPYTEVSKELQELFKFIDEAIAELAKSTASVPRFLKDKE